MTASVELTIKGDVEVLRLQPGDRIVVTLEHRITHEVAADIKALVEKAIPGHVVLVVSEGMRVSSVTEAKA